MKSGKYQDVLPYLLFFFALGIRLVYLLQLSKNPHFDYISPAFDHFNLDKSAISFANGDWLARAPNNSFAPLYKYFLGIIYWLFGRNFYIIYSIQFAMGALASVLVFLITRDLFGLRAGLLAYLGFALHTTEIIYEGIILREAFITFWGIVSFYLLLRLPTARTSLVTATLALSFFIQGRPNTILCLPFVCIFLRNEVFNALDARARMKSWLVFSGTLVGSFVPLLIQCYLVHGHFVFFDSSGPQTFISGNLINYSGVGFDAEVIDTHLKKHLLGYRANIQFLLQYIAENPIEFIKLYLRKIYFFFNDFETPTNISVYLYREFSSLLRGLLNHFAIFSALGLVGIVLAIKNERKLFLLYAYTFSLTLAVVLFLIEDRYRLPAVPYYIIFSAYAADSTLAWLERRDYKKVLLTMIVSGLLYFAFLETRGLERARIIDYLNVGTAYLSKTNGRDEAKGYEYFKRAWDYSRSLNLESRRPQLVQSFLRKYYFNKAIDPTVDDEKKIDWLKKSLYFDYSDATTHYFLALTLYNNKKIQEALLESLQALVIQPEPPDRQALTGLIYTFIPNGQRLALHHWVMARKLSATDYATVKVLQDRLVEAGLLVLGRADGAPGEYEISLKGMNELPSLQNEVQPIAGFPLNLSLPENVSQWSPAEVQQYLIHMYQYLILHDKENAAGAYYQMAMLYWKKNGNERAAYYFFEKAWDNGLQFPALNDLLNSMSTQQATEPIPW